MVQWPGTVGKPRGGIHISAMAGSPTLDWAGRTLGRFHGRPPRPVSRDPFRLILYEQVAYLVPDPIRRAAFKRLQTEVGLTAEAILAAPAATLRSIARAGGSIGVLERAARIRESAELVASRWGGDLGRALSLPLREARKALTAFPMIGPPGADRILAVTGAHAVFGLDSNGLRVCVRLGWGKETAGYSTSYRSVQEAVADQLPTRPARLADLAALLRKHGETVCRRSAPDCPACPLALRCRHAIDHRPARP